MATPTDAEYRAQLLAELTDTPGALLEGQLPGLWALYPQYTGYRRYLAVKAQAITVLIGDLERTLQRLLASGTVTGPEVQAVQAMLAVRLAQREALLVELAQLSGATGAGAVVAGRLTTDAPIAPPVAGWPDANAPRYGGDPYRY